jgi:8-oxo-dGTP pyrophosphatase MutT (NUDIX family)
MTNAERLERLREALGTSLPGHDGFLQFSGYQRPDIAAVMVQKPPPRESAVLALLYPKDAVLHTLLMLRPTYDGVHSGQVAFPGGRREPEDPSLMHTALREFTEETGASDTAIEVLGPLSPVYIPPSRSLVTPYVAYTESLGKLSPDPREVDTLIETPVDRLLDYDVMKKGPQFIKVLGRTSTVAYFDVQGHVVWGATAMMLAELRELLIRSR